MRLNGIASKISRKSDLESITESFNHILQNPVFQTDDNLREFRKYLEDNYQNHISLTHNRIIPRNFKEKIGIYPFEFLQIYRISKAIEMMKKTNLGVSEVAFKVGYNDLRTFERHFKKYVKITPYDYKKFTYSLKKN
nr:helix-turn-helix transcriptional regulator [Candidatus Woesearchaeota archaeon]